MEDTIIYYKQLRGVEHYGCEKGVNTGYLNLAPLNIKQNPNL